MTRFLTSLVLMAAVATGTLAGQDANTTAALVKHLKTSRDFTLKVAEAMPASDYGFQLTPAQKSFAQQLLHLSSDLDYFLTAFNGETFKRKKPASENKEDVIAFVKKEYDNAIDQVSKLRPEQLEKSYSLEGTNATGLDVVLGMLDHCTHHRASAEMYLRAKGIKPPEYEF